ncbi:MAG: glutamine-hydrolyzing GMP synthase, partial [Fimbriimonadales bacterium]
MTTPIGAHEQVIILDFGGQYTQLIARRVRECNVFCEILPYDTPLAEIRRRHPKGVLLSGGPASVYEPNAPRVDPELFTLGIPVLGICYGHQLMAHLLGGVVAPAPQREYGRTLLTVVHAEPLFDELDFHLTCWMSHGDRVETPPAGFVVLAETENTPVAAMGDRARHLYGVQFHPEVAHTPFGMHLLRNFLYKVCGCRGDWTMRNFIPESIASIRERVGRERVLCAVSGGVDSCTVAALVQKAIGEQLTCIFVDHGLMRQGEAEQVRMLF